MHYQNTNSNKSNWMPKPLGRKGDLNSWVERMERACPYPELGEVVWLDGYSGRTAYKAIGFKSNGDVIWQRGKVIKH